MSYCDNNAEISYINEDGDRRLLAKPIKYFYEMQELFSGSNANGSLAIDQQTCYNIDRKSDSSDHEGLNDMSTYAHPINIAKEDSDTLPSDVKSPSKRQPKPKSRFTDVTEKIGNTMDRLVNQLASPPPPPMPQLCDPYV
uniref:Uncharacterized protein n=1 Tax=Oryza glumipatula TaxID=40148 RepID=A0A0E0BKP4_9ORYZ